ncbi:unnamed protein product [Camellia sinensis]
MECYVAPADSVLVAQADYDLCGQIRIPFSSLKHWTAMLLSMLLQKPNLNLKDAFMDCDHENDATVKLNADLKHTSFRTSEPISEHAYPCSATSQFQIHCRSSFNIMGEMNKYIGFDGIGSASNYLNHGGMWSLSGMTETGPSKYSMSVLQNTACQ